MNNHVEATKVLLNKYESSIVAMNSDGILAKDAGIWHPVIGKVFDRFNENFHSKVKKLSKHGKEVEEEDFDLMRGTS